MEKTVAEPKVASTAPKVRMLLSISGISGPVKTAPYVGWMEVNSISFGVGLGIGARRRDRSRSRSPRRRRSVSPPRREDKINNIKNKDMEEDPLDIHPHIANEPSMSEISVTKDVDAASTSIFAMCLSRKMNPEVKLVVFKDDEMLYSYTLKDVLISGLSQKFSARNPKNGRQRGFFNDDFPTSESLSLNYRSITVSHGPNSASYDKVEDSMTLNGESLPNYQGRSEEQYERFVAKKASSPPTSSSDVKK